MCRSTFLVPVLALVVALTGCGSSSGSAGSTSPSNEPAPTAEELAAVLRSAAATTEWGKTVTSVTVVKKFRQPVIQVWSDAQAVGGDTHDSGLGPFDRLIQGVRLAFFEAVDPDTADDVASAVDATLRAQSPDGPWCAEVHVGGGSLPPSSRGTKRIGPAPAKTPSGPEGIKAWIDATYGPASGDPVDEEWYRAIQSVSFSAKSRQVMVRANLPQNDPNTPAQADMIVMAVTEPFFGAPARTFETVRVVCPDYELVAGCTIDNPYVK